MNEYLIPVFLSVISTLVVLSIKGLYEFLCRLFLYIKFICSIQTKHQVRLFNILKYHGEIISEKFDMTYEFKKGDKTNTIGDDSISLLSGFYSLLISSSMILFKVKGVCHNFHNDKAGTETFHPEIVKSFKRYLILKLFFNLNKS